MDLQYAPVWLDINTGSNLNLNDEILRGDQVKKRNEENSKTNTTAEEVLVGDTVTLKEKKDKHAAKEMFIVTSKNDSEVKVQKVLHTLMPEAGKIMSKVYVIKICS